MNNISFMGSPQYRWYDYELKGKDGEFLNVSDVLEPRSDASKVRRNHDGDIVEFTSRKNTTAQKGSSRRRTTEVTDKRRTAETAPTRNGRSHNKKGDRIKQGALAVGISALVLIGGAKLADKFSAPEPNFDANNHSAAEVADFYDIDERAIILANRIDDPETPLGEIILPTQYSMYGDDIAELEEKLENDKLSDNKRKKLEAELDVLKNKQAEQDELATVYVDEEGKYAYIIPTSSDVESEDFKDAFGIKDGVIRAYNDNLDYVWASDGTEDMPGHYRDYTGSDIPAEGIRVPLDKLGKKD